jgi:hypothetical protein
MTPVSFTGFGPLALLLMLVVGIIVQWRNNRSQQRN